MSLAVEIRALSERFQADLRAAHDYHHHTRLAWRLLRSQTRRGLQFAVRNPVTGSVVDAERLLALSAEYESVFLNESVFQHLIALFEDFLFELLRLWLTAHPAGIPNKDRKPVDLATVIEAPDRAAILRTVIDRELNALKYERPSAWFRYLNDRVKLGLPTDEQIERCAEAKASRDILTHNRGVVNPTYLEKSGRLARYAIGQRLEVPEPYLHDAWDVIRAMAGDLVASTVAKA